LRGRTVRTRADLNGTAPLPKTVEFLTVKHYIADAWSGRGVYVSPNGAGYVLVQPSSAKDRRTVRRR
jgi:myo-inositol-hexaphosphate 3-phosphohydrolase